MKLRGIAAFVMALALTVAASGVYADNLQTYFTTDITIKSTEPPGEWTLGPLVRPPNGQQTGYWIAFLNVQQANRKKSFTLDIYAGPNNTGDLSKITLQEFDGKRTPPPQNVQDIAGWKQVPEKNWTSQGRPVRTVKWLFSAQPAWERLRLVVQEGGPNEILIAGSSVCLEAKKKPNNHPRLQVDGGSFGAPGAGAMDGPQHIKRISWFPKNQTIDQTAPPTLSFPPASGSWFYSYSSVDPDGNPRPLGGVMFETSGTGLAPGDAWQLEFSLVSTAADLYDLYAFDADGGNTESYVVDAQDANDVVVPTANPWTLGAASLLMALLAWLTPNRRRALRAGSPANLG